MKDDRLYLIHIGECIDGLVKVVDRTEIEANDWSLTPGRYVGVAPEEEDKNFDFEDALRDILLLRPMSGKVVV